MKRADADRNRAFRERPRSNYLWCLHCERGYERGKWRERDGLQLCPYHDCGGDTVLDAFDWDEVRDYHPEYPAAPRWGVHYPYESSWERRQQIVRATPPLAREAALAKAKELGVATAEEGPGSFREALKPGTASESGDEPDLSLVNQIWGSILEGRDPTWWLIIKPGDAFAGHETSADFRGCLTAEEARATWEEGWREVDP